MSRASRVIDNFVLKFTNFHNHHNKGRSGVNFNDAVKLADPDHPGLVQESATYLLHTPSYG